MEFGGKEAIGIWQTNEAAEARIRCFPGDWKIRDVDSSGDF